MAGWNQLKTLVHYEILQKKLEGYNTDSFNEKLDMAGDDKAQIMRIYNELSDIQTDGRFPFYEPSDYEGIRNSRPTGTGRLPVYPVGIKQEDKFLGAWLGRCCGCALGKPFENDCFMSGFNGIPGYKNIKLWFEGADSLPIKGYVPLNSSAETRYGLFLAEWGKKSVKENIRFMEADDDIRYTLLGLEMLEEKGLNWDSWDLGKMWHRKLPYGLVCTAETQSYLNFAEVTDHNEKSKPQDWADKNKYVRTYMNPYREWIGAQIRVDAYAYGLAGNPELAAEISYRDASFSHEKNGIYGAMFMSAMIAAAFAEDDVSRVIETGLNVIPKNCRLSCAVRESVKIAKRVGSPFELAEALWDQLGHYSPAHAINNAALCAASLVFAQGDFERAITTAVMGGWDTDCNGASVGSIMGALVGAKNIPDRWVNPLNDTIYSGIAGSNPVLISQCAARSLNVFRQIQKSLLH